MSLLNWSKRLLNLIRMMGNKMQFTLNKNTILDITPIHGENQVEISIRRVNGEGTISKKGNVLITPISTSHLRNISGAFRAYCIAVDLLADAELEYESENE